MKKTKCKKTGPIRPSADSEDVPTHVGANGYVFVLLKKLNSQESSPFYLHELVAGTFVPNPNNYTKVKHKNGNKLDNRAENLEWVEISDY